MNFGIIGVVIATAALPSGAVAQEASQTAASPTQPGWLQKPTAEQLTNAYPFLAAVNRVSGRTTLLCNVENNGRVTNCAVEPGTETPLDFGFGAASLKLARFFRMTPGSDGPTGTVSIPIIWKIAGAADPPISPAEEKRRLDELRAALDPAAANPLIEAAFPVQEPAVGAPGPIGKWFPERAMRAGVSGVAVLRCTVAAEQKLSDCKGLGGAPLDFGFDLAALAMAEAGYMRAPADRDLGAVVRVVVKFPKPPPAP